MSLNTRRYCKVERYFQQELTREYPHLKSWKVVEKIMNDEYENGELIDSHVSYRWDSQQGGCYTVTYIYETIKE